MRLPFRAGAHEQSGSALVEFSLIVSLLMLILFGIITFGIVMSFKSQMTQAAEEGARAAIGVPYTPTDPSQVVATATAKANSSLGSDHACGIGGTTCNVSVGACPSLASMNCVTVKITTDTRVLVPSIPLLDSVLPNQLTETAVVQLNAP